MAENRVLRYSTKRVDGNLPWTVTWQFCSKAGGVCDMGALAAFTRRDEAWEYARTRRVEAAKAEKWVSENVPKEHGNG